MWEGASGILRQTVFYNILQCLQFHLSESLLPIIRKYFRNTLSGPLYYHLIKIYKRTAEQLRELPPDAALAASHKSYKTDYHIYCIRFTP